MSNQLSIFLTSADTIGSKLVDTSDPAEHSRQKNRDFAKWERLQELSEQLHKRGSGKHKLS